MNSYAGIGFLSLQKVHSVEDVIRILQKFLSENQMTAEVFKNSDHNMGGKP